MRKAFVVSILTTALASCSTSSAPAGSAATFTPQPHANLAQVMRGIPFTFSNIVFDAQAEDPGAPRKPADVAAGATETFKNVYGGWQEVENSALALSEAAHLLMIPGRQCENGKPVPVQEATYRKAAEGLAAAGRAAYKAAQSKSMDAMVEVSETVSVACSNCHEPYRDFDDQSKRCTPVDVKTAG
jgi:cytochrome c556